MKPLPVAVAALLLGSATWAAEPVFREPFELKAVVDKDRVWTEKFGPVPYVHEDGVYLFPDEKFGVKLEIKDGAIVAVTYLPDAEKADLSFEFSQELEGEQVMAMLTMQNRTKYTLTMRALMMVPGQKKPIPTSIVPLHAGLTNFESWPHALRQLLLHDIAIAKAAAE
jgi:hypothetical protein